MKISLQVWGQTDVGLRRERNEDFFLFDEEIGLYIVADGMGGHRGGEVASKLAAETLRSSVRKSLSAAGGRKPQPRTVLTQAYEEASRTVFDVSQDPGSDLQGMGTTLVAALEFDGVLYIANVGDSRAYIFARDRLWQLTEDHSLMNEQLRAGLIRESDVETYSGKNVITRSVGFEREVQVDIIERQVVGGEFYLICSDGLSGLVDDKRIGELFRTSKPSELVSNCVNEAKANGGDDNITVLAIYAQPQSA